VIRFDLIPNPRPSLAGLPTAFSLVSAIVPPSPVLSNLTHASIVKSPVPKAKSLLRVNDILSLLPSKSKYPPLPEL
jgi:hypothetical protein